MVSLAVWCVVATAAAALLPGGLAVHLMAASKQRQGHSTIVQNEALRQTLRICNAYAHEGRMNVSLVRTGEAVGILSYKACGDFTATLQEGDRLNFAVVSSGMLRAMPVGTFKIRDIEVSDLVQPLLLVVQRRGGQSLSAAFQSHAFDVGAESVAQVAVMDAYQHSPEGVEAPQALAMSRVLQLDKGGGEAATASSLAQITQQQDLPLSSVANVQPGNYQVFLRGQGGHATTAPTHFQALPSGSYVVLRVGAASPSPRQQQTTAGVDEAASFPEELVVFPQAAAEVPKKSVSEVLASTLHAARTWLFSL